ncbi:MAG: hypothetical protein ACLFVS_07360 [Candidatus Acetothermia bacterium]
MSGESVYSVYTWTFAGIYLDWPRRPPELVWLNPLRVTDRCFPSAVGMLDVASIKGAVIRVWLETSCYLLPGKE